MTTRACYPNGLRSNSVRQMGSQYILQPIEMGPMNQSCEKELPDRIGTIMSRDAKTLTDMTNLEMIDLCRFSCYNRMMRTIARIMSAFKERSFKEYSRNLVENYLRKQKHY